MIIQESPLESGKLLKNEVSFVHLKNIEEDTHEMTLIDEGDISMFEVISIFSDEINYAIEYPCGAQPFETLEEEIGKIMNH